MEQVALRAGPTPLANSTVAVLPALLLALPLTATASSLAVLDFELKDLTLNPDLSAETRRAATLRPLLVERLAGYHQLDVRDNPASAAICP